MTRNLLRRVARLEAQLQAPGQRLLRLAERLNLEPQRLLKAATGHESELAPHLGADGTITWEGYLLLLKLLGIDPTRESTRPSTPESAALREENNAKTTQNNAKNNPSLTRRKRPSRK